MSTARIPDGTPLGLVQVGLPNSGHQSTPGRSDPPVKPTSEVAHQPGQQPAALNPDALIHDLAIVLAGSLHPRAQIGPAPRLATRRVRDVLKIEDGELISAIERKIRVWLGPAVECSEERSRAPRDNGGALGGTRLGNPCDEDGLTR